MAKLSISNLITKNSVKKFTLKPTADEFTVFILAFGLLKYTACVVSVASGFAFFYYKLKDLITGFANADVVSAFLAVILLVCLEIITNTSTAKGFKMLFKQRFAAASGCVIIAALFFCTSFKISCEGIYLALSDTHKETANITAKYSDDAAELKRANAAKIANYESDIAALIGPAWNNGALTTEQLRMRQTYRNAIDSIYKTEKKDLAALMAAQSSELAAANAAASSSAEDYRGYVAIILLLEILANGILQYYNKKILHDTDTAIEKKEFIDNYINESRAELAAAIEDNLHKEKALYMSIIAEKSEQARQKEHAAVQEKPRPQQQPKKAAGFTIPTPEPTPEPTPAPDTAQEPTPAPVESSPQFSAAHSSSGQGGYNTGVCALCGEPFKMRTTWQKYCCEAHKLQYNANIKGCIIKGVAPDYKAFPNITRIA